MITVESINYYKPHWHDDLIVFMLVLEGSVSASIGCDNYRLVKDDVLLIGAEDVHSFKKTEEDNLVLFARFDCRILERDFPGISNWNMTGEIGSEKNNTDLDRLRFLIAETALGGNEYSLLKYCRDTFLSINTLLRRQDITPSQMDIFFNINAYIHKKHKEQLSLGDIAEYINYSLNDTSFLLKQITGMSFIEYLCSIRCLAAERLLVSSDESIKKIAMECGFPDARALGRCFKKLYKKTPLEYRDEIKENFPYKMLSKFDLHNLSEKKVHGLIESYTCSDNRIISIDLANLPAGIVFNKPSLGIPDKPVNSDGYDAISAMIVGLIEGKIKKLKQTDDEGTSLFHGDCGLITHSGIKKAVFYVYEFMSSINTILKNEDGILIGNGDKGLQILLYPESGQNYDKRCKLRLVFNSLEDDFIVNRYLVDYKHGNPYRFWDKLGRPEKLNPKIEELIMKYSLPELEFSVIKNRRSFEINEYLPQEGAVMISISPTLH